MIISVGLIIPIAFFSVFGLLALVAKNQKENDRFISELQFFLRHRTINHNRVKAQMAVLRTRFETLQRTYESREELETLESNSSSFAGPLAQTEFVEAQATKMEELELEITTIREALSGNFKDEISNYMQKVEGLSERLGKAREEFQAEQNISILEGIKSKNTL